MTPIFFASTAAAGLADVVEVACRLTLVKPYADSSAILEDSRTIDALVVNTVPHDGFSTEFGPLATKQVPIELLGGVRASEAAKSAAATTAVRKVIRAKAEGLGTDSFISPEIEEVRLRAADAFMLTVANSVSKDPVAQCWSLQRNTP